MAYVTTHQSAPAAFFDRLSAAISSFRQARQDQRMFRKTVSELRALSDRELNDLGLSRSNLLEVARQSVYSK